MPHSNVGVGVGALRWGDAVRDGAAPAAPDAEPNKKSAPALLIVVIVAIPLIVVTIAILLIVVTIAILLIVVIVAILLIIVMIAMLNGYLAQRVPSILSSPAALGDAESRARLGDVRLGD